MKNISQKLDVLASVCVIVVACVLGVIGYRSLRPGSPSRGHGIEVGSHVSIKNIDWKSSSATLVMALSTKCHFCSESGPFYQELTTRLSEKSGIHQLAIFPQSAPEGLDYLKSLRVNISDVRHQDFSSIPISGTPTLLLVDKTGTVTEKWTGKLAAKQQATLLQSLGL
jgi:hypothetical protein